MEQFSTLDIGCGYRPKGQVNVDLFTEETIHRPSGKRVDPKTVPNFIKADALHLPFKSNMFNAVYSYHVIEHVESPVKLLQEAIRVSNEKVIITCPHRFAPRIQRNPSHRWGITRTWLRNTLQRLNVDWKVKTTYRPFFFIGPIGIFNCPNEIKIHLNKIRRQNAKNRTSVRVRNNLGNRPP